MHLIKYIFYNFIFWSYYIGLLIKRNLFSLFCLHYNTEYELIQKNLKLSFFYFLFENGFIKKYNQYYLFNYVSAKLKKLYFNLLADEKSLVSFRQIPHLTHAKIVFILYHSLGMWDHQINLFNLFNIKKFGIIGRKSILDKFLQNYKLRNNGNILNKLKNINIEVVFCPVEDGIKNTNRIISLLNENIPLVIPYDAFFGWLDMNKIKQECFKKQENIKYFYYHYKNRKILMVPRFLLYLLHKTQATGIPVYVHRKWNNRDVIYFGDQISVKKDQNIEEIGRKKYQIIYDFMMKRGINNYWAWEGIKTLSNNISYLWKKKAENTDLPVNLISKVYKLNKNVIIQKTKNNKYITVLYPFAFIKINNFINEIIIMIKKSGRINLKNINNNNIIEIEKNLSNLLQLQIIQFADL